MRDTPFRTSGRVAGEDFFGRTEVIRAVVRQLRSGSNVAIVGAPRSGKTSLLTILFRNYRHAERDALLWFTDMRELATLDDLVEEFYVATGAQTQDHSLLSLGKTLKQFDKRLVLFLDSAERFAEPPFNEEALFAVLSSYLAGQSVSLCIATSLPPDQILKNKIGFPLHTHFVRSDLPPFTSEECWELIQKKLQWTGVRFTDDEIDKLASDSQGNPAELQRMAAELFRQKTAEQDRGGDQSVLVGRTDRKR